MGASLRKRNYKPTSQDRPHDAGAEQPMLTAHRVSLSLEGSDECGATATSQHHGEISEQSDGEPSDTNTGDDIFSTRMREDEQDTTSPVEATSCYIASSAMRDALRHLSHDSGENEFESWLRQHSELRIIVTGRTGVGKSTLLNGLTGINTFAEGHDLKPCTSHVVTSKYKRYGISAVVHDCPGLQDGSGREEEYLQEIKEKVIEGVDIMLYCISMKVRSAAELRRHCNAIDMLTKTLGNGIWGNAVVVLTFANSYEMGLQQAGHNNHEIVQNFNQRLEEWKCEIHSALKRNGVEDSVIDKITVLPAGYFKKPSLPGRKFWLSELWAHVFVAVSEYGQPAYVKLSEGRLKHESEATNDETVTSASNQPIFVGPMVESILSKATSQGAAAAGSIIFGNQPGPIGAAVTASGATGFLIGKLLKSLYAKFKAKRRRVPPVNLQTPIEDTCL